MSASNLEVRSVIDQVPSEIRDAISGLKGENELAIVVILIQEDGLSFQEIKESLNLHQQTLTNSLDRLQNGGIVTRRTIVDPEIDVSTKYEVTTFGKRLLDGLYNAIQPMSFRPFTTQVFSEERQWGTAERMYDTILVESMSTTAATNLEDAIQTGGPNRPTISDLEV